MDDGAAPSGAVTLNAADATGRRVVDAARATFATSGLRSTTMEDIARAAGVGRATLYRRFGSKDALVQTVLHAELRDYLAELNASTRHVEGFDAQIAEGFVVTLRYVRERSLLSAVVQLDGESGLASYTVLAGPVIAAARDYLAARIEIAQRDGDAATFDPAPVAELIVRLCHSLMLTPGGAIPDDGDAARTFARQVLVPILTRR
jgi:AcrR family transcriptional regulator